MEENQKNENKVISRQTIISAIIGLIIGILLTCLVGFCLDYFAKSAGMAKLKYGDETIATVNGEAITTQNLYDRAKAINGLSLMISEVDKIILEGTKKAREKAKETMRDVKKAMKLDYFE